ncbi:D-glycerate dehydrogenase [Chitinophaga horti]|uniref:D-glycerate dehydrogenase n=1 Tax=Chitinophaga horti TaxID=2920382 RepID=A0ABY6J6P5_9BACT|nr:D-glycerate dehydrogenase [Chitinophaga horti]UYQ95344.1 D-glycerate dehydrogenase [Chitinophaga horti]
MKLFVTRAIAPEALQLLQDAGIEVTQWQEQRELEPEELIGHCMNHHALLVAGKSKIDRQFLSICHHLKVIALHSVGYDNVDVPAATEHGIPIGNTPGVLSAATAETAFLLMMAVSRKAFYMHRRILNGEWGFTAPMDNLGISLQGKTLGIFGLGKIGMEMARKSIAVYDMKVIYHNRHRNEEAEQTYGAEYVSFEELLSRSDVLSVHAGLSSETKEKFNTDAFRKMKKEAIFINAARGGIHNEKDLVTALNNGLIWGAGLDVTNPEPMQPDNPLLTMPTVAVLPHIGSATVETRTAMAEIAARNIIAGLRGERLPHAVNPEVYN